MTKRVRVLAVDDSALMRRTLRRIIEAAPGLELAGLARDGEDALIKARELRPDVVSMDINMPKLDGITATEAILQEKICPVVVVSRLTRQSASTTFECLELGAFDFVAKPDGTVSAEMNTVEVELVAKLQAAAEAGVLDRTGRAAERLRQRPAPAKMRTTPAMAAPRAVAIGISTGGPATLMQVLPLIPADIPASLFLVQRMPPSFLPAFVRRLDDNCLLKVVEAVSGMKIEPGVCYVAPGGMHLCPHRNVSGELVIRTPSIPATLFVPSVSVMMGAVLAAYGNATIGVLMTGTGDDGADQMVAIRGKGGATIAESEETAVVWGMPREAAERGGAAVIAPSYAIAGEIVKAVQRRIE
ncbi:MAG: chemotaxis-specific protein-glutamate methyltransferase CheB [Acidobacteria bacterium]|nr:chemotaxis-specific protein-glutamate methyltransferase CheB [Acidobacteriota bacterium]